jgi:hypothetical protein
MSPFYISGQTLKWTTSTLIMLYDVERVLADIDADHGAQLDFETWRAPSSPTMSRSCEVARRQ